MKRHQFKYIIALLFSLLLVTPSLAVPKLSPEKIGAKAHILIEANSELVLAEYNATERLEPASITKLMTAYVVYQSIQNGVLSLDDKTTISKHARKMGGSRMFLELDSKVSIRDLLSGLVIQSGNDAAVALAEAVAGDEESFVDLMNKQAQLLDMNDSQFKNVTGWPAEGHYMSAKDIATLALAIIHDFPEHYKIYKQKSFTWNKISQDNRNALLRTDPHVDGLKTGHTKAAGYCLAASALQDDMRLVSVVLSTKSVGARARASKKLLAYGFDNFANRTLYPADQVIAQTAVENGSDNRVGVTAGKAITLPLPKNSPTQGLKAKLVVDTPPQAPFEKGHVVGKINITRDDAPLYSTSAVAATGVEEMGFFKRLWRGIADTVSGWFS